MTLYNNEIFELIKSDVQGKITLDKPMKSITWLRVGGNAELFFQPSDLLDLRRFLTLLPEEIDTLPIGVCSNILVGEAGINGATIRLGRGFSNIENDGCYVTVGAAVLDSRVADFSAQRGIDLSFLKTIPGTIGGAVKMNAGCYGMCLADVFISCDVVTRAGQVETLSKADLHFTYRNSGLEDNSIVTSVKLKGKKKKPDQINKKMAENQRKRAESQPIREKTGGSTFKNPKLAHIHSGSVMSAWELIDRADLRGHKIGGAQVSTVHSNFLINTGFANAADFEALGELIQRRVYSESGVNLEWEIKKVGFSKERKRAISPITMDPLNANK